MPWLRREVETGGLRDTEVLVAPRRRTSRGRFGDPALSEETAARQELSRDRGRCSGSTPSEEAVCPAPAPTEAGASTSPSHRSAKAVRKSVLPGDDAPSRRSDPPRHPSRRHQPPKRLLTASQVRHRLASWLMSSTTLRAPVRGQSAWFDVLLRSAEAVRW